MLIDPKHIRRGNYNTISGHDLKSRNSNIILNRRMGSALEDFQDDLHELEKEYQLLLSYMLIHHGLVIEIEDEDYVILKDGEQVTGYFSDNLTNIIMEAIDALGQTLTYQEVYQKGFQDGQNSLLPVEDDPSTFDDTDKYHPGG